MPVLWIILMREKPNEAINSDARKHTAASITVLRSYYSAASRFNAGAGYCSRYVIKIISER